MASYSLPTGVMKPLWAFAGQYNLATLPLHAHQVLGAFAAYESILLFVAPAISKFLAPKVYPTLPRRTKINWDIRIVSFVQAIFISACALHVIFTDKNRADMTRDQRLWSYSPEYGRVQAFAAGYFMWDVLISTQHFSVGGPTSLAHAIAALLVTTVGFRPFANFYGVNFVLYELSTPFLNLHWWLDKLNMTGGTLQLWNGICLIVTFFGCRLVWGSFQTWKLSKDILSAWRANAAGECFTPFHVMNHGVLSSPKATEVACSYEFPRNLLLAYLIGNTVLSALNFYWFGLMLKALRSRFMEKPQVVTNGKKST